MEHLRRQRGVRPTRSADTRQAYEQLRAGIRAGSVATGDRLGEPMLSESLGASRRSVRAALAILAQEGIVVRRPRVGTRIGRRIIEIPIGGAHPRPDRFEPVATALLRDTVGPADQEVRDRFGGAGRAVRIVEQLAHCAGEPLYLRTSWALPEGTPAGNPPRRSVAVVAAIGARDEVAWRLRLVPGRPVLFRELVITDDEGVVREISHTYFRGDRVALASGSADPRGGSR